MTLSKRQQMSGFRWMLTLEYVFLGYVAVHHWGWLDGMAAIIAMMIVVGAIRVRFTTDDAWPSGCDGTP